MEQKIDYTVVSSKTSFKAESNSETHRNRSYCSSGITFEIAEMGIPLKMNLRNENEFKEQSFQVHDVERDESGGNDNNSEHHLILSEWLENERNTSSSNVILLDPEPEPDPQLAGSSSSQENSDTDTTDATTATVTVVSEENPIKCKLCHLQLTSEIQVKNHVRMCWHSNKSKHRFCVICQMSFSLAEDLNRHNKKHFLEKDDNILLEDDDEADDDASNSGSVPLKEWIQNQRKYSHKVIILEPDPTADDKFEFESASIIKDANTDNQVTCKLCGLKLVSDSVVKKHVQKCWEFNKNQHIYCVPCEITFAFHFGLQHHNKIQHFDNAENITEVLLKEKDTAEKQEREIKSDDELCPSPSPLGELGKWIRKQQKDTLNVILLEPDPTCEDYTIQTVCEASSLKCKLCGFHLKSEAEVKKHVLMCYQFNKTHHRFCVPCNTPFTYTKSLQRHNKNKHFAGFKEIVPFPTPTTEKVYEVSYDAVSSLNSTDDQGNRHNNSNSEIGESTTFRLGEIGEWIKKERRKDSTNVILLEPDPTAGIHPDTEAGSIISETRSLTCKLCEIKLITETQIKRHVKRCWLFNKSQHRYCVQCKVTYAYTKGLQRHNKRKHS